MRLLLFGNSGSGKTTLARRLAAAHGLPVLSLDAIVWDPERVAVPRAPAAVRADLQAFLERHPAWILEGCYGDLVDAARAHATLLVFLNPGCDACLAHCRARPWEPDKYATVAEQDARLPFLLAWVAGYYTRDDDLSLAAHRRLFDAHAGPKVELTGAETIAAFTPA